VVEKKRRIEYEVQTDWDAKRGEVPWESVTTVRVRPGGATGAVGEAVELLGAWQRDYPHHKFRVVRRVVVTTETVVAGEGSNV